VFAKLPTWLSALRVASNLNHIDDRVTMRVMDRRAVAAVGAVMLATAACGGRVIDETVGEPTGGGTPTTTATSPPPKTSPGNSNNRADDLVGSQTALPDCKRGAPPRGGDACEFLTGGLCYETKIEACACACPHKTGSVCTSGFPNPDGHVVVTCS
jgi:hypothetical protein